MTNNEQLNAYCRHEFNTNHKGCMTLAAQTRLHNDWAAAIFNWIWSLPA